MAGGRLRVLYLGGLGRSGSTLIERLIGQLPGVCPVGELVHLWQRGITEGERCGCGEPFRECPFWQQVGKAAFGGWDQVDVSRVAALRPGWTGTGSFPRSRGGTSARAGARNWTSTPLITPGCTPRSPR